MVTLEHVRIALASATSTPIASLSPALIPMLRNLPRLQSFSLVLYTKTIVSIADLLSIASLTNLAYSIGLPSDREFEPKAVKILPTAQDLIDTPLTLRLLEALELVDIQSPVIVTYDEALQITGKIKSTSPDHLSLFDFSHDEQASFGWPSIDDYKDNIEEPPTQNDVWRGSLKAFSPDPVGWETRDLNVHVDSRGNVTPMSQVAINGDYSHIT